MRTSKTIACLILCCCANSIKAQDTLTRNMIYKTTVRILSDPSFKCKGALYEVKDSSISISSRRIEDYNSGKVESLSFPVGDLKLIHTRKTGNGGKGAWIGAVSGLAAGALLGLAATNGTLLSPAGDMALYGSFGALLGTPIGFTVGRIAGHKKTRINGSMDEFNLNKDELTDYAIKK